METKNKQTEKETYSGMLSTTTTYGVGRKVDFIRYKDKRKSEITGSSFRLRTVEEVEHLIANLQEAVKDMKQGGNQ